MITPEERERSYERYELYRENRLRYEAPGEAIGLIATVVAIIVLLKFGLNFYLLLGSILAVLIGGAIILSLDYKKRHMSHSDSATENMIDRIMESTLPQDAEVIETDGKKMVVSVPKDEADQIMAKIKQEAEKKGMRIKIHKEERQPSNDEKSTNMGYVNKNNQRNNGRTDEPGSGLNQWFYEMECLNCGHKYKANGHDIWLRKCPKCQGGKP